MILGIDFFQKYKIELEFENQVVRAAGHNIIWSQAPVSTPAKQACSVHVQDGQSTWENSFSTLAVDCEIDECAIPNFCKKPEFHLPPCNPFYLDLLSQYRDLFSSLPGILTQCTITNGVKPIRVPPRRVPAHF